MSERMIALGKSGDFFGPLYPYIIDDDVTDVDYNGREVWITDSDNCRHVCKDLILSQDFVDRARGKWCEQGIQPAKSGLGGRDGKSAHYHCA